MLITPVYYSYSCSSPLTYPHVPKATVCNHLICDLPLFYLSDISPINTCFLLSSSIILIFWALAIRMALQIFHQFFFSKDHLTHYNIILFSGSSFQKFLEQFNLFGLFSIISHPYVTCSYCLINYLFCIFWSYYVLLIHPFLYLAMTYIFILLKKYFFHNSILI